MTAYEQLLLWVSELGQGTWTEFREAHDWTVQPRVGQRRPLPTTTAHAFSILGHMEVDWQARVWSVAPPALTILPGAGAHAVLTGSRTQMLTEKLRDLAANADDFYCDQFTQAWGPDALFIAAADETGVERLADELGIKYEPCISERLAQLLAPIDSHLALAHSTPPAKGYGVERFDDESLRFLATTADTQPGLYQYGVSYRSEFRWLDETGTYFALDRATAVYVELRRCRRGVLRYQRANVNGTLIVPFHAQLPALQARTAAMCSGLMPTLADRYWNYANVPRDTAHRIAESLGQDIEPSSQTRTRRHTSG